MKQRIYLPTEYAEILADKAHAAGVSPELYVQTLIANHHICGGPVAVPASPATQAPSTPPDEPEIKLSGNWGSMGGL